MAFFCFDNWPLVCRSDWPVPPQLRSWKFCPRICAMCFTFLGRLPPPTPLLNFFVAPTAIKRVRPCFFTSVNFLSIFCCTFSNEGLIYGFLGFIFAPFPLYLPPHLCFVSRLFLAKNTPIEPRAYFPVFAPPRSQHLSQLPPPFSRLKRRISLSPVVNDPGRPFAASRK